MAELGNLTARIVLSLQRMSTVKIRTGSRLHTPSARIGAAHAAFGLIWRFSSVLHKSSASFTGCTQAVSLSRLPELPR
jgi:hypothetical protein